MARSKKNRNSEKVYEFLLKNASDPVPPTVREICKATGITSTSTVHAALAALECEGHIKRDARSSRSIRLVGTENTAMVPVLGKITAGVPILAVEQVESFIPFTANEAEREGLFALRVSGLSMINAGILDGDIIVADKNMQSRNGDIVAALIDDEATVKRLVIEKGEKPYLMPENPDFDPIRPDHMEILGRVIGSFRKY